MHWPFVFCVGENSVLRNWPAGRGWHASAQGLPVQPWNRLAKHGQYQLSRVHRVQALVPGQAMVAQAQK